jgi:hypothetical protein
MIFVKLQENLLLQKSLSILIFAKLQENHLPQKGSVEL